ncbi:MAG: insulinase family protein, partial [Candidatus Aenigmarchaeota archaeon]|nr:insulinase family protein [Candidatus Aenigmarchaeota archaeon]MDW8149302.1 insulinase family protein [Candidatus Aenigmarchaeota archaeon]
FEKNTFKREKNAVLSEMENIGGDSIENLIPIAVFGESDYGDPIEGYEDTVNSISKEELEEFKIKFYSAKNISLLIEGMFNENHLNIVRKNFSSLESTDVTRKTPTRLSGSDIVKKINFGKHIYYSKSFEIDLFEVDFSTLQSFIWLVSGTSHSLVLDIFRKRYGISYDISFELSGLYPDRAILSLIIRGYRKNKDKLIEKAYSELIHEIMSKNFEKYIEYARRPLKFSYEKIKTDLYTRLDVESVTIPWIGKTLDDFYSKINSIKQIDVLKILDSLKNERIVKLIPG